MSETQTARQFWIQSPGRAAIVSAELPARQDYQVLVRTLYSGVSRGTESLVFRGEVPQSQHQLMRAPFQDGDFPGPVKYGYMSVGEVLEGPDGLAHRTVFCLYPHQDLYCVPATAVVPLPAGLPADRAVLAANMETAINIVWDARPTVGDRIVVVGAGVVGLLTAWLCRQIPGTRVTVVDINAARGPVADALGLHLTLALPIESDADLVVHASGNPEGLDGALAAAGLDATVVEASWFGRRSVEIALGESFHSKRLTLKSSQVGHLAPDRMPRWTHERRLALALDLLRDSALDVLITGESDFEELPRVLQRLSDDPGDTLCHRIRYPLP